MQLNNKFFKSATLAFFAASIFVAGSASAKQNSVDFTASISTSELSASTPFCASQQAGIGHGSGLTTLFSPSPSLPSSSNEIFQASLSSSDCVTPGPAVFLNGPPMYLDFGPGVFTLMGAGGDSIFAQYNGRLTLDLQLLAAGSVTYKFDASTTFQVVGGTGRYEKAKGNGTITGNEVMTASGSIGSLKATGHIVY